MRTTNFWKGLTKGTRFQIMFYFFVLVIGVIAFLLPLYTDVSNYRDILIGFGTAFIAASILGFAQRLFFYDDFEGEMDTLVSTSIHDYLSSKMLPFIENGVEQLYLKRKFAVKEFTKYLRGETERIVIVGSSLMGLLDPVESNEEKKQFAKLLRQKIQDRVKVLLLLTHPSLAFLREGAEGRDRNHIKNEIIGALDYLTKPVDNGGIGIPFENIRLYHGTPTIFTIITKEKMLINPYPYQSTALGSFCFEIAKKEDREGLYAQILDAHFEKPWSNPRNYTQLTEAKLNELDNIPLVDLFPDRKEQIIGKKPAVV
jgi:hypothetical protein